VQKGKANISIRACKGGEEKNPFLEGIEKREKKRTAAASKNLIRKACGFR